MELIDEHEPGGPVNADTREAEIPDALSSDSRAINNLPTVAAADAKIKSGTIVRLKRVADDDQSCEETKTLGGRAC